MRRFQWLTILIIAGLILTGCAPADSLVGVEEQIQSIDVQPALPAEPQATQPAATEVIMVNECLDCHSDQERLTETADAVESTAESESKGVG